MEQIVGAMEAVSKRQVVTDLVHMLGDKVIKLADDATFRLWILLIIFVIFRTIENIVTIVYIAPQNVNGTSSC